MRTSPAPFRAWHRLPAPAQLFAVGLVLYTIGRASVNWFRPEGSTLAVWWPVAGLALVAVLIATPRQRGWVLATHLVATTAVNLSAGQDVLVAASLGVANAAEILLIIAVLERGRPDPRRLHEPADLGRLVLAALIGSVFVGVAGGLIMHGPQTGAVLSTVRSIAPSHLSALLLFSTLPLRGTPSRSEASTPEVMGQWLLVTVVTAVVFAPGQRAALVFLVIPVLVWSALRSGVRAVGAQLLTVAGIAATMTLRGGGPFAPHADGPIASVTESVILVQLFAVSVAIVMLSTFLVVQARREAAAEVDLRDQRTRLVQEQGLTGIVDLRADDGGLRIVDVNRIAARFLEASPPELVGRSWCDRFVDDDRAVLRRGVRDLLAREMPAWHGELHAIVNGVDRWFEVALFPTPAPEGPPRFTAQMLDVTARRVTEMRLSDLALRDDLTGAANRLLLQDRLALALAAAARDDRRVGLLFLDLDGFKPINDRLGHRAGDEVLVEVARRLGECVRATDTVARIGGDEFAILLPQLFGTTEADATVRRVRTALGAPVRLAVGEVTIGASIGVVTGSGAEDPHELIHRADLAMYAQKPYARTT